MTDTNTDNEEAIRSKQAEIEKIMQELEILVVPPGTPTTTALTAAAQSEKSLVQNAAGTSLVSGNVSSTTTTTPIDTQLVTTTNINIKQLLIDKKYKNLEAVLDKEGKRKYTMQLFAMLPEDYHKDLTNLILKNVKFYEYLLNKTAGIANLICSEFTPARLRVVDTIKLEFHDDIESLPTTCSNLTKWKDRTTQYKEEMKQIIIDQARFDLDKRRKVILNTLVTKIFHLTEGYVKTECVLLKEMLPKTNSGYVTVSVLTFISKVNNSFFVSTFAQSRSVVRWYIRTEELDSSECTTEVESLLGEGDNDPPTQDETEFINLISALILKFSPPVLVDTIAGVDVWKDQKESETVCKNYFKNKQNDESNETKRRRPRYSYFIR